MSGDACPSCGRTLRLLATSSNSRSYRCDSCQRVHNVDYTPGAGGRVMKWFPLVVLGGFVLLVLLGVLDVI